MCIIYVGIAGEELHKPDFTSLEKRDNARMSGLIVKKLVATENGLDLLASDFINGGYENER